MKGGCHLLAPHTHFSPPPRPPAPPSPPAGAPASFSKRRALFSDPANRAGRAFDPSLVWTFYFFQHFVDISRYHLAVTGFYRFHLDK